MTPWTAACQVSLSFTISWSLLKLLSIESVILSNHLILCCPLLLLPSVFPNIRVFSNMSALHIRWPKYWSLSNATSNEGPSKPSMQDLLSFFFLVSLVAMIMEKFWKSHPEDGNKYKSSLCPSLPPENMQKKETPPHTTYREPTN